MQIVLQNNHYQIIDVLGENTHCTVYHVLSQDKEYVIKSQTSEYVESSSTSLSIRNNIENELLIEQSLDYPFIIKPITYSYSYDSTLMLILYPKYNCSLENYILENKTIGNELMQKIIKALLYLEEKQTNHNDLLCCNIVLDDYNNPIIIDFETATSPVSRPVRAVNTLQIFPESYHPTVDLCTLLSDMLYHLLPGSADFFLLRKQLSWLCDISNTENFDYRFSDYFPLGYACEEFFDNLKFREKTLKEFCELFSYNI